MTVGSGIFEVYPNTTLIHVSLDSSPCNQNYESRLLVKDYIFERARQFVYDTFVKAGLKNEFKHLERTVYWVLRLKPDADISLLVAALSHDIERAFRFKETVREIKRKGFIDEKFYEQHQKVGAEIVENFLRKEGMSNKFIKKVKHFVSCHEKGGNKEADVLRDADSISFFENNAELFIKHKLPIFGEKLVNEKFKWMYNRASYKAKKIIREKYSKYLEL